MMVITYQCKYIPHMPIVMYTYMTCIAYMSVQYKCMWNLLCGLQQGGFSQSSSLPGEGTCLSPAECHCTGQEFHTGELMWWECDGQYGSHEARARGKEVALKVVRNKGCVWVY